MANLRVLVPEATTNYIKNPSVKIDTTGYVAVGATITRSLDRTRFGISSLKVVTSGSSLYEGAYYRVNGLAGIQSPVTVSVYVRGTGAVRIRLMEGSSQWASKAVFLNDTRWQRISVSGRCIGSDDVRLYVETDKNIRAVTFYADGFQMEPLSEVTTYCLDPNTIVNSKQGIKRLGDVIVGDELLNELGEYNKVEKLWGVKTNSYKITLENGTNIIASGDHRFSCTRYVSGYSGKWKWKFEETKTLKTGDYLQLYDSPSVLKQDNSVKEISFAYLLGYLLGDGYFCSKTTRNQPLIGWTFGKDEMEIAKIVEQKYKDVFSFKKGKNYPTAKFSSPTEIELRTQDRTTAEIFKNADFPTDCVASQKYIPKVVYEYSKQELMAFLAGMIDSDGCIDLRGNMHIDSSSKEIIEKLHSLFSVKLGVHGWFGEYTDNNNFNGEERTAYRVSFKMADVKFLKDNGLILSHPRKAKRIELAVGDKRRRSAKIVSIEELGDWDLIDITLSPNHTFIANGIITHNCDGDQPGCRWNSVAHSTISTRNANTRQGGRWVALAGPCRDENDIYVTRMGGFGFPPIALNTQSYAELPGSYYQNTKVFSRPLTLAFHVKKKNIRPLGAPKLDALHGLRQQLIDIFKPDLAKNNQAFLFEYDEGDKPLYLSMRYEAGLEGDWDIRNRWINEFPIRFLAVSPFFLEDSYETTALDFQQDFLANFIVGRVDGKWNKLNYGVDGTVYAMASGPNGELYVGGNFTQVNNGAPAPYPTLSAKFIAYWDGVQFQRLGTGAGIGTRVKAIAVAPNGYVYVTGLFSSIGGVAANNVAYWNGSAWNAMGTGLNADGEDIKVAPNGDVYVCGQFSTAGGNAARYIGRWNGSAWNSIGAYGGLNDPAYTLDISEDGTTIYFGGSFDDQYSLSANTLMYIAMYVVDTNTFSAMSTGMDDFVAKVLISRDGTVYAGGSFTTAGGESALYAAQWNGATWLGLGDGLNNEIMSLAITDDGLLYAGGVFTEAGGVEARQLAIWNGHSWVHSDIVIGNGSTPTVYSIEVSENGDVYIGGSLFTATNSKTAEITDVNNVGSAELSPIVYILGPCNLRWLENQTSGARLLFDMTVLANEEVYIDLGAGTIKSMMRGDLLYTLLPGSDFRKFTLLPSINKIASLMINDTAAVMRILYQPKHWSADSTSREAEL